MQESIQRFGFSKLKTAKIYNHRKINHATSGKATYMLLFNTIFS